jgi:hypothetical protein
MVYNFILIYMSAQKKIPPIEKYVYEDKFSVQLHIRDKKILAELVERYVLDLVEVNETDKLNFQAVVYATKKQITALEQEKVEMKVGENQSEIGRSRQKEVSNEDRFKGGKIPPKGLGIKK